MAFWNLYIYSFPLSGGCLLYITNIRIFKTRNLYLSTVLSTMPNNAYIQKKQAAWLCTMPPAAVQYIIFSIKKLSRCSGACGLRTLPGRRVALSSNASGRTITIRCRLLFGPRQRPPCVRQVSGPSFSSQWRQKGPGVAAPGEGQHLAAPCNIRTMLLSRL
jgi:hypothetical protein